MDTIQKLKVSEKGELLSRAISVFLETYDLTVPELVCFLRFFYKSK